MEILKRWTYLSVVLTVMTFSSAGCMRHPELKLTCEAMPPEVYSGNVVIVSAAANSSDPAKNNSVVYNWSGAGVVGNGQTARVDTTSMAPGVHTVRAEVKEGKPGKEGRRPGESATCSSAFTVKKFEPPTISCSANPPTMFTGASSRIMCVGVSPTDRPLTYRYSSNGGNIVGLGSIAIFFASESLGPVAITAAVEDDENHHGSTQTTVTIEAAPESLSPHVQPLCRVDFAADRAHPTRIANQHDSCLDKVGLALQTNRNAKVVVVTNSTEIEKEKTFLQEKSRAKNKKADVHYFAEQRAVNVKDFLVREEGVDPSRIAIATGIDNDRNGQAYLVPDGVSFDAEVQGTTWINDSAFTPEKPVADDKANAGSS